MAPQVPRLVRMGIKTDVDGVSMASSWLHMQSFRMWLTPDSLGVNRVIKDNINDNIYRLLGSPLDRPLVIKRAFMLLRDSLIVRPKYIRYH